MTSHTEQLHEQIGPGPFVAGSIYRQMFELAEIADAALAERDQARQALQRVNDLAAEFARSVSLWTGDVLLTKIRAALAGPVGDPE